MFYIFLYTRYKVKCILVYIFFSLIIKNTLPLQPIKGLSLLDDCWFYFHLSADRDGRSLDGLGLMSSRYAEYPTSYYARLALICPAGN